MDETVTIKVNIEKYIEIKDYYSSFIIKENDNYIDYIAFKDEITITGYLSTKKKKSIVFQGENASLEAGRWNEELTIYTHKEGLKEEKRWLDFSDQIGSDEVGVGDFLLPMIVVAAYVKETQIFELKELGITDSKKINDAKILEIVPKIIKKYKFSKLTLHNEKYNEMINKGENINSLKAKMHNRALANIHQEIIDVDHIYVDEFVNENKYYSYLNKEDEPIVRDIAFKTKGESYFPCVALASVVARYYLLKEKEKLEEKYHLEFPFGASNQVDKKAKIILEKVGIDEFNKLVKTNFKNYQRITDNSIE